MTAVEMEARGYWRKMRALTKDVSREDFLSGSIDGRVCPEYLLCLEGEARGQREEHALNGLLGQRLALHFTGKIACVHCGRKTRKSYSQGYCYPCFKSLARCDMCILKPETCHFHQNTCREPDWGERHCMTDHIVYLANTSGLKVGITRATQVPTRWIDQGAALAMPVWRAGTRRISGLLEAAAREQLDDRTDWRKMLSGNPPPVDFATERAALFERLKNVVADVKAEFGDSALEEILVSAAVEFEYPIQGLPERFSTFNVALQPEIESRLLGIKGQYLIFEDGVINARKYNGYELEVRVL